MIRFTFIVLGILAFVSSMVGCHKSTAPSKTSPQTKEEKKIIHNTIQEHASGILYCYEKHMVANPDDYYRGKFIVRFSLSPMGEVTHVITESEKFNQHVTLRNCIIDTFLKMQFAKLSHETEVIYPIHFQMK